eukprot:1099449-Rhodomonas_salina.2
MAPRRAAESYAVSGTDLAYPYRLPGTAVALLCSYSESMLLRRALARVIEGDMRQYCSSMKSPSFYGGEPELFVLVSANAVQSAYATNCLLVAQYKLPTRSAVLTRAYAGTRPRSSGGPSPYTCRSSYRILRILAWVLGHRVVLHTA